MSCARASISPVIVSAISRSGIHETNPVCEPAISAAPGTGMSRLSSFVSAIACSMASPITVLRQFGMEPCALDTLPDGTHRWHFTQPPPHDENDLDRELAAFEAKHGHGRA